MTVPPRTRHLVDPELLPLLDLFPTPPITAEQVLESRRTFNRFIRGRAADADPAVIRSEDHVTTEDAHRIRLLVYRPAAARAAGSPALLHIHGGGYTIGSADMNDADNRARALLIGGVVVSVDYRLPPEFPHPTPVEDCHAGLRWLAEAAPRLGVDPARIGVVGESAGGGLAAALALLDRDKGGGLLSHQHLIAPMLDDQSPQAGDNAFAGEFVFTRAQSRFGWDSLIGVGGTGSPVSPYAAAMRAESLAGLPPAFISVGALDLFVDENVRYASRLLRAGVAAELHVWPGAFHGFEAMRGAQVAAAAAAASAAALRRAFKS